VSAALLEFEADGCLFNSVIDESIVERNKLSRDHFDRFLSRNSTDQSRNGRDFTRSVVTPTHTVVHKNEPTVFVTKFIRYSDENGKTRAHAFLLTATPPNTAPAAAIKLILPPLSRGGSRILEWGGSGGIILSAGHTLGIFSLSVSIQTSD